MVKKARQDCKGSYSVIARIEEKFDEVKKVKLDERNKVIHELCEYFYKNVTPISIKNNGTDWNVFLQMVLMLPSNHEKFKHNTLRDLVKTIFLF